MRKLKIFGITGCLLSACAEMPSGPTVAAMPGPYKPFVVFQADDLECRQYAHAQIGQSPSEAAANSTAAGAVTGTAVGAAAGALIGHGGAGAATGAGVGLLAGTAICADNGNRLEAGRGIGLGYCRGYCHGFCNNRPLSYVLPANIFGNPV